MQHSLLLELKTYVTTESGQMEQLSLRKKYLRHSHRSLLFTRLICLILSRTIQKKKLRLF